jgi:hypothetical protein
MDTAAQIANVFRICEEVRGLSELPLHDKVEAINTIRAVLHQISPFHAEPVDFVKWVQADEVKANDYNPNSVASPEMALLETSILEDGYTQPIVVFAEDGKYTEWCSEPIRLRNMEHSVLHSREGT